MHGTDFGTGGHGWRPAWTKISRRFSKAPKRKAALAGGFFSFSQLSELGGEVHLDEAALDGAVRGGILHGADHGIGVVADEVAEDGFEHELALAVDQADFAVLLDEGDVFAADEGGGVFKLRVDDELPAVVGKAPLARGGQDEVKLFPVRARLDVVVGRDDDAAPAVDDAAVKGAVAAFEDIVALGRASGRSRGCRRTARERSRCPPCP